MLRLLCYPLPLYDLQHAGADLLRGDYWSGCGVASQRSEMTHQGSTDTSPLVFVDYSECQLGGSRSHNDVASATDDHSSSTFFHYCDQGNMVGEVNVHEEFVLLRKVLSRRNGGKATGH
jgi:hypothetical protein